MKSIHNQHVAELARQINGRLFFSVFISLGSLEQVQNMRIHQNLNIKFDIPLTPGVC